MPLPPIQFNPDTTARAMRRVSAALSRLRVQCPGHEFEIHSKVADALSRDGIQFRREVPLGDRCRIDFLTQGGIGIEVKRGKPNSGAVRRQLERYAARDSVAGIIIVVDRNIFDVPSELNGKPIEYISLSHLWGIALS